MQDNNKIFDAAHAFVAEAEGGLTDDKDDRGGVTNYGVCLKFLQEVQPGATRADIEAMTPERAKELFKKHFWDVCQCDKMPAPVAAVVYDTSVNCGDGHAIKFLQRALKVKDDGVIGAKTLDALAQNRSIKNLVENYLYYRMLYYVRIIEKDKSQEAFFKGWFKRILHSHDEVMHNDIYNNGNGCRGTRDTGGAAV